MCGIAGFIDRSTRMRLEQLEMVARAMSTRLSHRGPDGHGLWADPSAGIALGHRRLAVVDLTAAGHQPMISADDRWVLVFNGEIYNYLDLRTELLALGASISGSSDTAVILAAICQWGVATTVRRLNGMFAFAAYDRKTRDLHLARDHLGIKPLYYAVIGDQLLFASELKALRPHPSFKPTLDRSAVAAYMRHNYIPAPMTIWREGRKLRPGHHLVFGPDGSLSETAFWDLRRHVAVDPSTQFAGSDEDAVEALDGLLRDAVQRQMLADVPLGAFLSGGIDSSTVVALMQAQTSERVRTFSIGFNEAGYDEAVHAKAVARHLGTEHTELYLDAREALKIVPHLGEWYDEPFADSSQIPTYLVSRMAREHVTVALSGDGGDECFGGYTRYLFAHNLSKRAEKLPPWSRRLLQNTLRGVPEATWDRLGSVVPSRYRPAHFGQKVHKLASAIAPMSQAEVYRRIVSQWQTPETVLHDASEPASVLMDPGLVEEIPDYLTRMQYLDAITYMPDDILVKVDRASMAVSLESRVPLLDHRVVEFAFALPNRMKVREGEGKWILRQVLDRYVPRRLTDRPKMGFGIPVDAWLRGPLKDWAWERLRPAALARHGVLREHPIQTAWDEHQSGRQNLAYPLWTALMLQDWLEREQDVEHAYLASAVG
jgi:asparagine synthase (glutamine-hydrolysing)